MSETPNKSIPLPKSNKGRSYFTDLKREFKKVSWPALPETHRLFGVVLSVCLLLMVVTGVIGFLAGTAIEFLLKGGRS